MVELSANDQQVFDDDGFLIVDELIDTATIPILRQAFDDLFSRKLETGLRADRTNWQEPGLTRQICNGWKSNRYIARIVLDENYFPIRWRVDGYLTPQITDFLEQDNNDRRY